MKNLPKIALGAWTRDNGGTFGGNLTADETAAVVETAKPLFGSSQITYTVTVYRGANLSYHDVFRRVSDGAVFRVTSNVTDSVLLMVKPLMVWPRPLKLPV